MHMEPRLEFVDALATLPNKTIRTFANQQVQPPHDVNKPTASVMPETLNTFLPGVSEEIISDVNLCKLVMHNAATKKFPEQTQLAEWYQFYLSGLNKFGWVNNGGIYKDISISKIGVTMDQIALDLAIGLIGSNAQMLANVGKKAVDAVKGNQQAIPILESEKVLGREGKYDFAPVWVDSSGQANMIINFVSLDARERNTGFLFWKTTRQSTTIKSASSRIYLDNSIFGGVRDSLRKKYLASAEKFILDLPDLDL